MHLFFLTFFFAISYFSHIFYYIWDKFYQRFFKNRKYKVHSIIKNSGNYDTFCDFGYWKWT